MIKETVDERQRHNLVAFGFSSLFPQDSSVVVSEGFCAVNVFKRNGGRRAAESFVRVVLMIFLSLLFPWNLWKRISRGTQSVSFEARNCVVFCATCPEAVRVFPVPGDHVTLSGHMTSGQLSTLSALRVDSQLLLHGLCSGFAMLHQIEQEHLCVVCVWCVCACVCVGQSTLFFNTESTCDNFYDRNV